MTETTINKSILNANNFRLLIDKVPTVEYFCQSVTIPSMTFAETVMPSRVGVDAYFPGDKIEFGTMNVTFLVDEDMQNYKEMYDWMDAILPIKDGSDYATITDSQRISTGELSSINNALAEYSQITLVVNTNKNIPNRFFKFYDCFPTSLGEITFQAGADGQPITCDISFRFTYFDIETTS